LHLAESRFRKTPVGMGCSADSKKVMLFDQMNAINLILPYRYQGMWVFDDPRVGLNKEPFVSGADTMIDVLVREIPNAQNGFRLLFSSTPFPGYQVKLDWVREEYGGNWYFSPEYKKEGWLCPALFKYFDKAPMEIFAKAEPISLVPGKT